MTNLKIYFETTLCTHKAEHFLGSEERQALIVLSYEILIAALSS